LIFAIGNQLTHSIIRQIHVSKQMKSKY